MTVRISVWHVVQLPDPPAPAAGGLCWHDKASSRGSTGDQVTSAGSSAGAGHPVLVGTALGTSCILLNGKACLTEN